MVKQKKIWAIPSVAICLFVLALPDQRNFENFRILFKDKGMQLISIEPSSGCYRVGSYRYTARDKSGKIERGLVCVNKSMRLFDMVPAQ
jgi:hypothetical protein